jgi:hypothetical protein
MQQRALAGPLNGWPIVGFAAVAIVAVVLAAIATAPDVPPPGARGARAGVAYRGPHGALARRATDGQLID